MKISNKKIMCLLCAVLAVVTLSSTVGYALSSTTKSIDVYTGVNIYIDDQKLDPTDTNGNPVEPFIYNGTTYLPVRALSQALGKVVQWDGKTSSVYVGKHESDKPAVWLTNMEPYTIGDYGGFKRYSSEKDNLGYTHYNVLRGSHTYETYRINGQYTEISGIFFQPYEYRGYSRDDQRLNIYGDGELLYTATVRGAGDDKGWIDPISFRVDITGVLELKVELKGEGTFPANGVLGDCGLWS